MAAQLAEQDLADYLALCREFPLLSISDKAQLDEAIARIGELIDRDDLSDGEKAYLDALADLVEVFEDEHVPIPAVSGLEVLRHLMEEHGLRQQDLVPLFGNKSTVSEVLSGKRALALPHIVKLSEHFGLPADVFLDRPVLLAGA